MEFYNTNETLKKLHFVLHAELLQITVSKPEWSEKKKKTKKQTLS